MEYGAIAALLTGALFGIFLASRHFLRKRLPPWAAVAHGLFGATGFALLLVTVIASPELTLARRALLVLVVAVFMGCVNVVFHIRGLRHKTILILGHALLAVSGVTTFGVALLLRAPRVLPPQIAPADERPSTTSPLVAADPATRDTEVATAEVPSAEARAKRMADVQSSWREASFLISFETGSARLRDESIPALERIALAIRAETRAFRIEIQGHADERGADVENLSLTRARAQAVLRALVARGVDRDQLSAAGFGARCPIDPACARDDAPVSCHSDESWARDRRVVLAVVQLGDEVATALACDRGAALVPRRDQEILARVTRH
jgi:outer membrane protein OmpA-like peptidoglycan-associated protein